MTTDIDLLIKQENELVLPSFDEEAAYAVGTLLRQRCAERKLAMVLDLRTWSRQLFYAAFAGTTALNEDIARRKANTVRMLSRSSYRVEVERGNDEKLFAKFLDLPPSDYVPIGGSFPVTVPGAGIIGAISVSGLPSRDDHGLVVDVLCEYLKKAPSSYALPHVS